MSLKAYAKLLRHAIGLCCAIYELVTNEKAPAYDEVMRRYN
jgi:hypothetical protein